MADEILNIFLLDWCAQFDLHGGSAELDFFDMIEEQLQIQHGLSFHSIALVNMSLLYTLYWLNSGYA